MLVQGIHNDNERSPKMKIFQFVDRNSPGITTDATPDPLEARQRLVRQFL